ncbi:DNA topoisomerase III [Klebsiella pneumoniae]|nr:DNA topoisomerase III [Klebsiella pneumoniae]
MLPIVPTQWKMEVKKDTADQFAVIRGLLKQVDSVVIATDADREGEVIARELLEYCKFTGPVERLWLSALDETSIRQALANKLPGSKTAPLYEAGLARARADWIFQVWRVGELRRVSPCARGLDDRHEPDPALYVEGTGTRLW